MDTIEQKVDTFVRSPKKNPTPNFKVGAPVYYLIDMVEFDYKHSAAKFYTRRVDAKVVKDHSNGKFDIELTVPPFSVEKDFEGEYLFP